MTLRTSLALTSLLLVATLLPAQQPQVVLQHREGPNAKADFAFPGIAPPSTTDAGNLAKATVLSGQIDTNGAGVQALFDGQLPEQQDQPNRNFFFAGGRGGRLLLDLGKDINVREIRTYSWHPNVRGPQVYTLYGADQTSAPNLELRRGQSPADHHWTQIVTIDSRSLSETPGGQYATLIRGANVTSALGSYRYLLFDIAPTSDRFRDAETFYSEIDIDDGQTYELLVPEQRLDTLRIAEKYTIHFDTTEAPDLQPWVQQELIPVCKEWYPKIVEMLPSDNYDAPQEFTIQFKDPMDGVAFAAGTRISAAAPWFRRELKREARGSIVHEMVHIVQQYQRRRGNRNPSWLVEGLADYIRWFLYEPVENRPQVNFARANYDDSYRTSAAFIDYVIDEYEPDLIEKLNAAMREGRYEVGLWKEYTGKTPEELWEEFSKR